MRILAGGPARETESELFLAHKASLEAQKGDFDLEIRHITVPDPLEPHEWAADKIERVAQARQQMMGVPFNCECGHPLTYPQHDHAMKCMSCDCSDGKPPGLEALFMVDTDVVLGPDVLAQMLKVDAPVVYGVFWTHSDWMGLPLRDCPQVWEIHPYSFTKPFWNALSMARHHVRLFPVAGGGACTLIRGRGFESHYHPIIPSFQKMAGMWKGEDRTFAVGCEFLGIPQIAVTGLDITHHYET